MSRSWASQLALRGDGPRGRRLHELRRLHAGILILLPWTTLVLPTPAGNAAAPTPPAVGTPTDWPVGAPVAAAVLVHQGSRHRLALADLVNGTYQDIAPGNADVDPVWSPDGARLAYVDGPRLMVLRPGHGPAVQVRGGLPRGKESQSPKGIAFSPDGRRLAVALPKAIEIWSLGDTAARLAAERGDIMFSHLVWVPDGNRLAACRWNGDSGPGMHESLAVYTLQGTALSSRVLQATTEGCEILGVRNGLWLVKRSKTGSEEILAFAAEGKPSRLRTLPPMISAHSYLAALDVIVAQYWTEDEGDPTRLDLFSLANKSRRPWLRQLRRISDLAPNDTGSFLMFTVPSQKALFGGGGKVFLGAADGQLTRQVLPVPGASPEKVFFSHPIPRPLPRTPQ